MSFHEMARLADILAEKHEQLASFGGEDTQWQEGAVWAARRLEAMAKARAFEETAKACATAQDQPEMPQP